MRNRYDDDEKDITETVVQFGVDLSWGDWRAEGVSRVHVVVEGCATSSEAIDKAITMCKPLRTDQPRSVSASAETFERRKPRQLATAHTIAIPESELEN